MTRSLPRRKWWPFFFLLCLVPFISILVRLALDSLGANPEEELLHITGEFFLRFLLLGLMATPFQRFFKLGGLMRYRRMLGLYAFFYGSLHLLVYVWISQYFDFAAIIEDISERTYILLGLLGWVFLVPLAVTSTQNMVTRLGAQNWISLHRLAYVATVAGLLHYWMSVKADIGGPAVHAGIFALLMLLRLIPRRKRKRAATGVT